MNDDERERRQKELAEKRRKLEQLKQDRQRRLDQEKSNADRLAQLANGTRCSLRKLTTRSLRAPMLGSP